MKKAPEGYNSEQKHYQTGYWGIYSTNSNRFCFGIQTLTKTEAMQKLKLKTGLPIKKTQFLVRSISTRNKWDFISPLKWREDFAEYKKENEKFKRKNKEKSK